jgi:hypothetical protein
MKYLTPKDLLVMPKEDWANINYYCTKDGNPRDEGKGITNVTVENKGTYIAVSWSDFGGDPSITLNSLYDPIKAIQDDSNSCYEHYLFI